MSENISEAWVGINETTAHLGVTPETIRNWIKKPISQFTRLVSSGSLDYLNWICG